MTTSLQTQRLVTILAGTALTLGVLGTTIVGASSAGAATPQTMRMASVGRTAAISLMGKGLVRTPVGGQVYVPLHAATVTSLGARSATSNLNARTSSRRIS